MAETGDLSINIIFLLFVCWGVRGSVNCQRIVFFLLLLVLEATYDGIEPAGTNHASFFYNMAIRSDGIVLLRNELIIRKSYLQLGTEDLLKRKSYARIRIKQNSHKEETGIDVRQNTDNKAKNRDACVATSQPYVFG